MCEACGKPGGQVQICSIVFVLCAECVEIYCVA